MTWGDNQLIYYLAAYAPLGLIGLWRWGVWGIKKLYARTYKNQFGWYQARVSVVTPVYNEDPKVFRAALESWVANEVDEIIAVIDYSDTTCIEIFNDFAAHNPNCHLIVIKEPGKRPALAAGIKKATSPIVALVDSDTIWGHNTKNEALVPFRNHRIGGVATRQGVLAPETLAQRMFNTHLNVRYLEEFPFLMARGGKVLTCLSGRTAFYRRAAIMPHLHDLVHETFWGKPVTSGDDKRLTYLIQQAGWQTAFQQKAMVYTPGERSFKTFLKQRLRWTRNSWRAELRALTQSWTWRNPRFVWYLLDRMVQPFAQLLAPIYFIVSILLGLWPSIIVLLLWWPVARSIRYLPHFRREARDLSLVPMYIVTLFFFAVLKIYALFTLNRQGWITRWDADRLPKVATAVQRLIPHVATTAVVIALGMGVFNYEQDAVAALVSRPEPAVAGISFSQQHDAIVVSGSLQTVTLPDIAQSVNDESILRETSAGHWELTRPLLLAGSTHLHITSPEVKKLKLVSHPHQFAFIDVQAGYVRIDGVEVTSWDTTIDQPDRTIQDGRAYIVARPDGRLDVTNATLSYLGFVHPNNASSETAGVTWYGGGLLASSEAKYNYIGSAVAGASGVRISQNTFHHNTRTGLLLTGEASHTVVSENAFNDNIVSGITVANADRSLITDNTFTDQPEGILIVTGSENVVVNNTLRNHARGIRLGREATDNILARNTFLEASITAYSVAQPAVNAIDDELLTTLQ